MTHFMENAVETADKVLLIMTPNFKAKADKRIGGVGYEISMVSQEMYESQEKVKFIPVRRKGANSECAPKFLKAFVSHDMSKDTSFDNDFHGLLREIYDEPEIKRPQRGERPVFIAQSKSKVNLSLIDDAANLLNTGMTTYAKWTMDIKLDSLEGQSQADILQLFNSNIIKHENSVLPSILSPSYKISHHPEIIYERPLQKYVVQNHFLHEKMKIEEGVIHYEFSEYSNQDLWLLLIAHPFMNLLYVLIILKSIHKKLDRDIRITVDINFFSDRKSMLYSDFSPFDYSRIYNMQNMVIPNSQAKVSLKFSEITESTLFTAFGKLYGVFVAENPQSSHPFVELDRPKFHSFVSKFLE